MAQKIQFDHCLQCQHLAGDDPDPEGDKRELDKAISELEGEEVIVTECTCVSLAKHRIPYHERATVFLCNPCMTAFVTMMNQKMASPLLVPKPGVEMP